MNIKAWCAKWWRKVLGFLLVLGGIAGLFLPFLQGIAMILAGLALMGNKRAEQWLLTVQTKARAWYRRWRGK